MSKPRAWIVTFPTGQKDIGWGRDLREAALYALNAACMPWCVKPERQEVASLRVALGIGPKGGFPK